MHETTACRRSARRSVGAIAVLAGLMMPIAGVSAADLELGRHLAAECMTCHGAARASGTIPDIFGHEQATFVQVMNAYRDKSLPNEAMQTVAGRLNDEDIASLALYFATAKKPN